MRHHLLAWALPYLITTFLDVSPARADDPCTGVVVSSTTTAFAAIAVDGPSIFAAWWDGRADVVGDVYAQRLDLQPVAQWTPNGVSVAVQPDVQRDPRIIGDGTGGAFMVWQDDRHGEGASEIYGQRLDAGGANLWASDGVNLSNLPFMSVAPQLVSDDAGGIIVIWVDQLGQWPTSPDNIFAMRVNASGSQVWTAVSYKTLCEAPGYQAPPRIVTDGAGGAVAVWRDHRGGNQDVYAARITVSGTQPWTGNGVPVCAATGNQDEPQIASDGAGGAIIVWQDARSGNNDIYAQRIDGSGAPMWTTDGVPISTATGDQSRPRIAAAESGEALIVWEHISDVYAQRIDATGAALWSAGGVPVAEALNSQSAPRIASDMSGGAYVVWADDRALLFNEDLYGQHIDAAGATTWDANGSLLCTFADGALLELVGDGNGGAALVWRAEDDQYLRAARLSANDPTGIGNVPSATRLRMLPNAPNPFNGTTEFRVYVDAVSPVVAEVYDVSGRRVAMYRIAVTEAGWNSFVVSDRDAEGRALASGVYFCRVRSGAATVTGKMVIAR